MQLNPSVPSPFVSAPHEDGAEATPTSPPAPRATPAPAYLPAAPTAPVLPVNFPERRELMALLQALVEGLVEHPQLVWVEELRSRERRVLEVHVAPSDLCRLLGPFGSTFQALRTALRRCTGPHEEGYQLHLIGDRQVWHATSDPDDGLWEYPEWLNASAEEPRATVESSNTQKSPSGTGTTESRF